MQAHHAYAIPAYDQALHLGMFKLHQGFFYVIFALLVICSPYACAVELTIYTVDWPPVSFKNGDKTDGMAVEMVEALKKRVGSMHRYSWCPGIVVTRLCSKTQMSCYLR